MDKRIGENWHRVVVIPFETPNFAIGIFLADAQKYLMASAYYVIGIYRCAQVRDQMGRYGLQETIQVWDASLPVIVFSPSPEDARNLFENEMRKPAEEEKHPREITIRKVSIAPIGGQLLTESGNVPLTWSKILEKSDALLQSTPVDDFEQGYWVDANTVVPSDKISFSVGTLESSVPDDVRSGLNWSADKQFFFLLHVLSPPVPPPPPAYEQEGDPVESETPDEPSPEEIEEMNVTLSETVAVIQARNSVAAAWLWRKYAANTPWNNLAIRITPLCGTIGMPN